MEIISNKKVVITGVTKGLGRSLTECFHEAGYLVAGIGRTEAEIYFLQKKFPECYFNVVDLTNRQAVSEWADDVISKIGPPEIIINNASIINHPARLWEVAPDEFDKLININIIGYWNIIRAFVPAMVRVNTGLIVNISSGWGKHGAAMFAPYSLSKFAVEGLTQSLALELPSNMAAVALSPGMINTQMLKICAPETAELAIRPDVWAREALGLLLKLGPKDNGKSLDVF